MNTASSYVVTALVIGMSALGAPALAGQSGRPSVTIQGTYGTHLSDGGDNQSLSVGISSPRFDFLVSAERLHQPSEVEHFEDGFSATRRGTVRFISAEVRFSPFSFERASPYILAGLGRGKTRLNVNEIFPDPVTNDAALAFAGGGVRVPVVSRLSVVADLRFVLLLEDSEDGGIYLFGPIRAGLAWRF